MRRPAFLLLLPLAIAACNPAPTPTQPPSATATLYVSPSGSDVASGSSSAPLRTVTKAVAIAKAGSSILLASGRYHESVQVYAKAVRIAAAPGASVVFDGSVPITDWTASGNGWERAWNPKPTVMSGAPVMASNPVAGHPDQLFVDSSAQRQVLTRAEVVAGTFYHDRTANKLIMGTDPTGRTVEASDLSWALYFNRAHGSSLSGVTVRRYATVASDMAAIRAYGNNIEIAGVTVNQNAYSGISVIGDGDAIHGSTINENGFIGIHAHKSSHLTVSESTVSSNNLSGFDPLHSAAGAKVTETSNVTFVSNYVAGNNGPGIWTDITSSSINVANNVTERNARSGIQIELSGHVVVAGNISLDNREAGIWILESNDVQVWNNAAYGNLREIWVEDGPRSSSASTPAATWDLQRVEVRNNVLGRGGPGEQALLNVDDWTNRRSGAAMGVTSDHNAYWLAPTSSTMRVARWARWPSPLALSATIGQQYASTGQDLHSRQSTATKNPYARNEASADYRMPTSAAPAASPPTNVAAVLGVRAGTPLPPGPTKVLARSGSSVQATPTAVPASSARPSVPPDLVADLIGPNRVQVRWGSALDDVAVTTYVLYRNGSEIASATGTMAVLDALAPGIHYFQIQAIDGDGNRSAKTAPVSIRIIDPTPSVPLNLHTAAAEAGTVRLTWTPSTDDVGAPHYAVFQNGVQVSTVTSPTASIGGLRGGTYWFQVQALDGDGHRSAKTAPFSIVV